MKTRQSSHLITD
jgi:hypothetical protein